MEIEVLLFIYIYGSGSTAFAYAKYDVIKRQKSNVHFIRVNPNNNF